MIREVQVVQNDLETKSVKLVADIVANASAQSGDVQAVLNTNADGVMRRFWALSDELVLKYSDGYCNGCAFPQATGNPRHLGYSEWWLDEVYEPQKGVEEEIASGSTEADQVITS